MTIAAGTRLERYEILSQLGAGGMGEVFLAQDTKLDRRVALKILTEEFAQDGDRMRRFVQEAKSASALSHPNIITIYEIGDADGSHFIATEYVEGETLTRRLRREPMSLRSSLDIAIQIASALQAAHNAGIVHRDIKPDNVMIRPDGLVKLLDFGIAKLTEKNREPVDEETATAIKGGTSPGMIVGTAAYMSPEQARGKQIDPRTDIFSFGVVLYEMLTLKQPFEGENPMDLIGAILHKEPKPIRQLLPEIPQDIERLINKTLRKDREERYQTAKDLLIDLRDAKQELEAQSRLERTTPLNQEGPDTLILTAATVDIPHTTSSAEYLVSEITKRKRSLAVLVVLLASIGLGYWVFGNRAAPAKQIESIAVMPFVNVSRDPNTEYLSDGISESLINSMSQWSQLKVIARSSVFKYKGKEIDPEEVAKTLGVGAIVTGRVVQRGDELQVSVELMNAQNKTQMWGEQYNRRAADLQAVQAEIARTISEKLRLRLTGAQEQQLTKQATGNPEAYQLYLTGLFYFQKGNIENIKKALDYYTQAVALDPKFAPAYASMAVAYSNLTTSGADPAEMLAKGRAAAQKALELDDSLAEAHAALAIIKRDEWDWSGAEREYKRAVELNPNYAGAHGNYALYLSRMGRAAEALSENKRAQEIDPLRIVFKSNEGAILYFARRYDEAIQVSQNVIRMQPDYANAHIYLGYTYEMKGMYAEAIAAYQKDISLDGETPSLLCYLGYAYAMSGKRGEALVILGKLKRTKEHVSPIELATLYVGLEDKEAALESLERAYREHDLQMQFLKVEPHFDSLRSEARFADLMGRVGLPQ